MSGPTLLYLADNVGATVGQVSLTFTGRSIGLFVGSLAYGFIMNKFKNFKAFLACGKQFCCLQAVLAKSLNALLLLLHKLNETLVFVNSVLLLFSIPR